MPLSQYCIKHNEYSELYHRLVLLVLNFIQMVLYSIYPFMSGFFQYFVCQFHPGYRVVVCSFLLAYYYCSTTLSFIHNLFIYSTHDGHLSFYQVGAMTNNAAMSILTLCIF